MPIQAAYDIFDRACSNPCATSRQRQFLRDCREVVHVAVTMLPSPLSELPGVLCYRLPEGLRLPIRSDVQMVAEDLAGRVQGAVFAQPGAPVYRHDCAAALAIMDYVEEALSASDALEDGPPLVH